MMPHAIKRLLSVLELSCYTAIYLALASGLFDVALTLPHSYEIPFYVVLGVVTILLVFTSLVWYQLLDIPRTLFIAFILFLFVFKYSDYGIISLPGETSPTQAFILSFLPLVMLFSARGKWYLWLCSMGLLWAGYILNLPVHFEAMSLVTAEPLIFVTSFSALSFLSSVARPPIKAHDGMKIVHAKTTQATTASTEVLEESERVTGIQLAIDDSDGGEVTNTLGFSGASKSKSEVEESLGRIVYIMNIVMGNAQSCTAYLYDERSNSIILTNSHSSMALKDRVSIGVEDGFLGRIIEKRATQLSQNKPLYSQDLKYYKENTKISSILAVPIFSREKEFFGVLAVDSPNQGAFKEAHTEAMRNLATVAGELLLNVRLRQLQEVNARRSQLLYDSSQQFTTSKNSMEILGYLLHFIGNTDRVNRVSSVVVDRTKQIVRVIKVLGENSDLYDGYAVTPSPASLVLVAIQTQRPVYEPSFQLSRVSRPLFAEGENIAPYTQSMYLVPLGETGTDHESYILIESAKRDAFKSEVQSSYDTLIRNGASAMEKASLYDRLNLMATTDGLTKLFNHRHFQLKLTERIAYGVAHKRPVSLLLMDIDHFKNFNDTYGHQVGDQVLQQLAQTLQSSIRPNDIPARYGGEEFVIILPETDVKEAIGLAERVREAVALMVINTSDAVLHVSVSIGVSALFHHTTSQEQLIGFADAAMYISKKDGRNRVTVYQPWMSEEQA